MPAPPESTTPMREERGIPRRPRSGIISSQRHPTQGYAETRPDGPMPRRSARPPPHPVRLGTNAHLPPHRTVLPPQSRRGRDSLTNRLLSGAASLVRRADQGAGGVLDVVAAATGSLEEGIGKLTERVNFVKKKGVMQRGGGPPLPQRTAATAARGRSQGGAAGRAGTTSQTEVLAPMRRSPTARKNPDTSVDIFSIMKEHASIDREGDSYDCSSSLEKEESAGEEETPILFASSSPTTTSFSTPSSSGDEAGDGVKKEKLTHPIASEMMGEGVTPFTHTTDTTTPTTNRQNFVDPFLNSSPTSTSASISASKPTSISPPAFSRSPSSVGSRRKQAIPGSYLRGLRLPTLPSFPPSIVFGIFRNRGRRDYASRYGWTEDDDSGRGILKTSTSGAAVRRQHRGGSRPGSGDGGGSGGADTPPKNLVQVSSSHLLTAAQSVPDAIAPLLLPVEIRQAASSCGFVRGFLWDGAATVLILSCIAAIGKIGGWRKVVAAVARGATGNMLEEDFLTMIIVGFSATAALLSYLSGAIWCRPDVVSRRKGGQAALKRRRWDDSLQSCLLLTTMHAGSCPLDLTTAQKHANDAVKYLAALRRADGYLMTIVSYLLCRIFWHSTAVTNLLHTTDAPNILELLPQEWTIETIKQLLIQTVTWTKDATANLFHSLAQPNAWTLLSAIASVALSRLLVSVEGKRFRSLATINHVAPRKLEEEGDVMARRLASAARGSAYRLRMVGCVAGALERWRVLSPRGKDFFHPPQSVTSPRGHTLPVALALCTILTLPQVLLYRFVPVTRCELFLLASSLVGVLVLLHSIDIVVGAHGLASTTRPIADFLISLRHAVQKEGGRGGHVHGGDPADDRQLLLEVRDLWAAHKAHRSWAVRGLTLSVGPGVTAILGDAGAGKTCFLTALGEQMMMTNTVDGASTSVVRGTVEVGGKELVSWDSGDGGLRRRIAVLLDDGTASADEARVAAGWTIGEFLEVGIINESNQGDSDATLVEECVAMALELVGLSPPSTPGSSSSIPPRLLSSTVALPSSTPPAHLASRATRPLTPSQFQRLRLASIFVRLLHTCRQNQQEKQLTPGWSKKGCLAGTLLLLDEPFALLSEYDAYTIVENLREAGATVLLASAKWGTGKIADAVAVLNGGGLLEVGSHEGLMAEGSARSLYATRCADL